MSRILICDDDAFYAEMLCIKLRETLEKLGEPAQIYCFQTPEDIPKGLLETCDIAFLDIDFAGKNYNGLDVARRIRNVQKDAVIIFVTNYPEYAPEGYEVQAFRYLLKNELNEKLKRYLSEALEQLTEAKQVFQLSIAGDVLRLPIDDIIYLEAQLHTVVFHVRKGGELVRHTIYSTLTSMEQQLSAFGFLRIQKSYLVNMRHLMKYMCNEAVLTGGIILKVSEKNYSQKKKEYLLWKGRK